jgi:ribosomal protein S24E
MQLNYRYSLNKLYYKMQIQKNVRNELLKRQEISIILEADKNPCFSEIAKELASELKKTEDCIFVYNIKGKFGRNSFLVKAYVYDNPEILMQMKEMSKTKKQKTAEKKAAEDALKTAAENKKAADVPTDAPVDAPSEAPVEEASS